MISFCVKPIGDTLYVQSPGLTGLDRAFLESARSALKEGWVPYADVIVAILHRFFREEDRQRLVEALDTLFESFPVEGHLAKNSISGHPMVLDQSVRTVSQEPLCCCSSKTFTNCTEVQLRDWTAADTNTARELVKGKDIAVSKAFTGTGFSNVRRHVFDDRHTSLQPDQVPNLGHAAVTLQVHVPRTGRTVRPLAGCCVAKPGPVLAS